MNLRGNEKNIGRQEKTKTNSGESKVKRGEGKKYCLSQEIFRNELVSMFTKFIM